MTDWVINPFENNKKLNSLDPFSKTPEQEEKFRKLEDVFKQKYNTDLEELFWNISPENIWKINWNYQNNWWDLKKALESVLSSFPLEYKDKKDLEWLIIFYIKKKKKERKQESSKENIELNNHNLKKEHPFVPILERYLEMWVLDKEEINSIIENLDNDNEMSIDAINAIERSNLSPNKKKKLIDVNNYLIKKEKKQEQDIISWKEIKIPNAFKQYESLSDKNDDIVQLIAIHYIPIKGKDWKINNKKDIDTAILKATNDTVFWKVFDREKMIFKNNFNIIKWDYSIKEKITALRKIVSFVNNNQWKKWKSILKQNAYFENVDRLQDLSLEEMKIKIKSLLKKSQKKANQNLQKELETIQKTKESEKIDSWEVFTGWKNDSTPENNNTKQEQN